jgi:preprotein translocase subunit SecE
MEYLIVFSVAAIMTVYVWILARYLQNARTQTSW